MDYLALCGFPLFSRQSEFAGAGALVRMDYLVTNGARQFGPGSDRFPGNPKQLGRLRGALRLPSGKESLTQKCSGAVPRENLTTLSRQDANGGASFFGPQNLKANPDQPTRPHPAPGNGRTRGYR